MQNIANKVVKSLQDFEKYLKLKFGKKQSTPQYIMYQDFFRCENSAKLLGYTFLKGDVAPPNKWIKLNSKALRIGIIVLILAEIVSMFSSIHQKLWHILVENALFCGAWVITGCKIFIVFHYNRAKIDEVIEILDKHFPHFGVD